MFQKEGRDYFLRFNHSDERDEEGIIEEIKVLNYLNSKASNIIKPIKSRNNKYVEAVETRKGQYFAVVFERMKGKHYEIEDLDKNQFYIWGQGLGKLHKLLNDTPQEATFKRNSWQDHLVFIEKNLPENEVLGINEVYKVKRWANNLEISDNNYGLIHFDFELDNLCWLDKKINILDLDECAYYWYAADIAFALRDLFENKVDPGNQNFIQFIKGYESEFTLDNNLIADMSWF